VTENLVRLPVDPVSAQFVTTDYAILVEAAEQFNVSPRTPTRVARLLEQARKQFALGGVDYNNFGTCCLTGFQAIEQLLRETLGEQAPRNGTLRNLVEKANKIGLLTEHQREYLDVFVLRFRNKIAHPAEPFRVTPGMSQEIMAGCHRFVVEFGEDHLSDQQPADGCLT
jgi:hypothetical protein